MLNWLKRKLRRDKPKPFEGLLLRTEFNEKGEALAVFKVVRGDLYQLARFNRSLIMPRFTFDPANPKILLSQPTQEEADVGEKPQLTQ